jgi:hypothetical protein
MNKKDRYIMEAFKEVFDKMQEEEEQAKKIIRDYRKILEWIKSQNGND